jgi:hypothetical protein
MQSVLGENSECLFKSLHLARSIFRVEHLGGSKVGADTFKVKMPAGGEFFAQLRQRADGRTKSVHSGIHFQVDRQVDLLLPGRFLEALDVPSFPNSGREIVGDDTVFLALPDAGHEEDACPDAGATEGAAFGGVGYAEPGSAFGFKSEGAFDGAVPVAIRLNDGANRNSGADMLLDRVKIGTERGKRDLGPGATVENQRTAIGDFRQLSARSVHLAIITTTRGAP